MKRGIFAFGIVAFVTGLSTSSLAQDVIPPPIDTTGVTLSGESLIGIEGRTISSDYQPLIGQTDSTTNLPIQGQIGVTSGQTIDLGEGVVLQVENGTEPVNHIQNPFPQDRTHDGDGVIRFRVDPNEVPQPGSSSTR